MKILRKSWGLTQTKKLFYKGLFSEGDVECEIVGYNQIEIKSSDIGKELGSDEPKYITTTLVLFVDGELHCISPGYLANMQKTDFSKTAQREYDPE